MEEELREKIKELEEEIENKDIMISALLNEIKSLKNRRVVTDNTQSKRIKIDDDTIYKIDRKPSQKTEIDINSQDRSSQKIDRKSSQKTEIDAKTENKFSPKIDRKSSPKIDNIAFNDRVTQEKTCITIEKVSKKQKDLTVKDLTLKESTSKESTLKESTLKDLTSKESTLKEQIDTLINHKRASRGFGNHYFFDDFMEYCVETVPFSFGPAHCEIKSPVKAYISQNSIRLAGFISRNINSYSLLQIYSTLSSISTVITPLESCVIFHDILLMIDDYTKLHFVFHALFKNKIDNDLLGSSILALISHQLKVDIDFHKSKKSIVQQLTALKCSYEFPKSTKSLEDFLLDLTIPIPVFSKNMIDENIYQYVFSIRMLTHYLDWDYTFNTYFNEVLYPRLGESDAYLLFLGICNYNFYRLFGNIESTQMVIELIKSKMERVSNTSVLSYLLIKQIDPLFTSFWLSENTKELVSQGWSIEYLSVYLLF